MKVNVYITENGVEKLVAQSRYVDEAIEAYCPYSDEIKDHEYTKACNELTDHGRFWVTPDILLVKI